MKKVILTAVAAAALAIPAAAVAEELLYVPDPTPNGAFSDDSGTGYVAVYDDGVVACNHNDAYTRPDTGEPLAGYIWVGPGHAANDPAGATPGGEIGAGNNTAEDDPSTAADESHGPCEDEEYGRG